MLISFTAGMVPTNSTSWIAECVPEVSISYGTNVYFRREYRLQVHVFSLTFLDWRQSDSRNIGENEKNFHGCLKEKMVQSNKTLTQKKGTKYLVGIRLENVKHKNEEHKTGEIERKIRNLQSMLETEIANAEPAGITKY